MSAAEGVAGRTSRIGLSPLAVRVLIAAGVFIAFALTTPGLLNPTFTILPLLRDTASLAIIGLAQL